MNTPDNSISLPLLRRAVRDMHLSAAEMAGWSAGVLSAFDRARVDAHLAVCDACRCLTEMPEPVYRLQVLRPGGQPPLGITPTLAADTAAPVTLACNTGDGRFLATWVRTGPQLRLFLCAGVESLAFARVAFRLHGRECQADLHNGRAELLLDPGEAPAPALSGFTVKECFALTEISGPSLCGEGSILGMAALMEPHGAVCFTALMAEGRLRLLTGGRVEEFTPGETPVLALASASPRQVLAAAGGWISLSDLKPDAPSQKLGPLPNATCLAWCRSASVVAAANTSGRIETWHAISGQHLRTVEAGAPVRSLALSPDGTALAASLDDGLLLSGPADFIRVPLDTPATALAYSPISPLLAAALHDGSRAFFQPATGQLFNRTDAAARPNARPAALAFDARNELHLITQQ